MRYTNFEDGAQPVLTVETTTRRLFRKQMTVYTRYQATERIAGKFYTWIKLPDKTIVPDHLSFQLDEWLADARRDAV